MFLLDENKLIELCRSWLLVLWLSGAPISSLCFNRQTTNSKCDSVTITAKVFHLFRGQQQPLLLASSALAKQEWRKITSDYISTAWSCTTRSSDIELFNCRMHSAMSYYSTVACIRPCRTAHHKAGEIIFRLLWSEGSAMSITFLCSIRVSYLSGVNRTILAERCHQQFKKIRPIVTEHACRNKLKWTAVLTRTSWFDVASAKPFEVQKTPLHLVIASGEIEMNEIDLSCMASILEDS